MPYQCISGAAVQSRKQQIFISSISVYPDPIAAGTDQDAPTQFIDVRDIARWTVFAAAANLTGSITY